MQVNSRGDRGWVVTWNSSCMITARSRRSAEAIEAGQLHAECCGLNEIRQIQANIYIIAETIVVGQLPPGPDKLQ